MVRVGRLVLIPVALLAFVALSEPSLAQTPATNPLAGDANAINGGKNIFRGRCGVCHGIDAKGYRGSDLTHGDWVHGGSDAQIFKTIQSGVAGTEMPANGNMSDDEIWMVIAYLRTLSSPGGGRSSAAMPPTAIACSGPRTAATAASAT